MSIDRIGTDKYLTASADEIEEIEHSENLGNYDAVAITEDGLYGVPGTAAENDVAEVLDVDPDNTYVKQVNENGRVSASATRVNDEQLKNLMNLAGCPSESLEGKTPEKSGHSADDVTDEEYGEIDQILTR